MIDWDQPVMTEDECEVRIFTTEGRGDGYPVVGERKGAFGIWHVDKWKIDGVAADMFGYRNTVKRNLVNVTQKHTQILNIARDEAGKFWGYLHDSRAKADDNAGNRTACIDVTFTEGEGLD